jgi:hypothetical protein
MRTPPSELHTLLALKRLDQVRPSATAITRLRLDPAIRTGSG